jgi:hypothetical protein
MGGCYGTRPYNSVATTEHRLFTRSKKNGLLWLLQDTRLFSGVTLLPHKADRQTSVM